MTEEEKKAIKWLKELYDIEKDFNSSKGKEESNIIKTLLNLIDKQQKEIEKLKRKINKYDDMGYIPRIAMLYISKDKIRDKIEQIDKEYFTILQNNDKEKNLDYINIVSAQHNSMKLVLEEVLEEN